MIDLNQEVKIVPKCNRFLKGFNMLEVYFDNRQDEIEINENIKKLIEDSINAALAIEKIKGNIEVSVSFVGNEEIKTLNKDYRGVDATTDVLSFPLLEEFIDDYLPLGDVIINTSKVIEQAKEYNHSIERELSYLTVHSLFHLLGYDHLNEEEKKEMRNQEKLAMQELKLFKSDVVHYEEE